MPALLGQTPTEHEYLYWEFYERGFQQAVRMGDWKGVRLKPNGAIELYHLPSDLGERYDVPDIVKRIEGLMRVAHVDSPHFPVRSG